MSTRLHVATRKGLFHIDRTGRGWAIAGVSHLGDNCTMVMHDARDGALYASLGHGHFGVKMHRSRDGGKSWQAIASPKYPAKPEGYVARMKPAEGKEYEWTLQMVWALTPGGADQPGLLWCGTLPGGLFVSRDHGDSWELNRPLWDDPRREEWFGGGADFPGIHSICVNARNSNHVVVAISCGGVWVTRDAGKTWTLQAKGIRAEYMPPDRAFDENIQDPHLLAMCSANPDAMYVQHHNGMFMSKDGAKTWTEIPLEAVPAPVFGFAVAVHPRDADQAWFVPAVKDEKRFAKDGKVTVTRTRDGGKSFQSLSKGLPQENAYHLVFRHSLDVDDGGDRLAFGSTTGSLWISEDQGDSWTTLSKDLPPVYAVRFEKQ